MVSFRFSSTICLLLSAAREAAAHLANVEYHCHFTADQYSLENESIMVLHARLFVTYIRL
jgi:hypothetical protein